jgi:hypothetical protein
MSKNIHTDFLFIKAEQDILSDIPFCVCLCLKRILALEYSDMTSFLISNLFLSGEM